MLERDDKIKPVTFFYTSSALSPTDIKFVNEMDITRKKQLQGEFVIQTERECKSNSSLLSQIIPAPSLSSPSPSCSLAHFRYLGHSQPSPPYIALAQPKQSELHCGALRLSFSLPPSLPLSATGVRRPTPAIHTRLSLLAIPIS